MRINSDGGTLFDPPYKPLVKVNVMGKYERTEVLNILHTVRGKDSDNLRNVLSVAVFRLNDEQAVALCDQIIQFLEEGKC